MHIPTLTIVGTVLLATQWETAAANKMYGIDMSDVCTGYDCMKQNGISFAIPRGYQSAEGNWWPVKQNLQNARNAGLTFVDTYFFPCREWGVKDQVNTFVNYLAQGRDTTHERQKPVEVKAFKKGQDFLDWRRENVQNTNDLYGMIWIDVELDEWHAGCNWQKFTPEQNCQYIREAVQAVKDVGRTPGIYTSPWEWSQIMGTQTYCQDLSYLPLWYNNYDGQEDYSDWTQIGGWSHPAIKQYNQNQNKCGLNIDPNVIVRNNNNEATQEQHKKFMDNDDDDSDDDSDNDDSDDDDNDHHHNSHHKKPHHHSHKRHHKHHHSHHKKE